MLFENLIVAVLMVSLCVCVHFFGLTGLIAIVRRDHFKRKSATSLVTQSAAIVVVVMALFFLHTIEIWMFAVLYAFLGEFQTFEEALYFSTSTFTTVGFGDLYLDEKWRLLSAIESAAGFLLIGWSTAFLVSITAKLRILEAQFDAPHKEKYSHDDKDDYKGS